MKAKTSVDRKIVCNMPGPTREIMSNWKDRKSWTTFEARKGWKKKQICRKAINISSTVNMFYTNIQKKVKADLHFKELGEMQEGSRGTNNQGQGRGRAKKSSHFRSQIKKFFNESVQKHKVLFNARIDVTHLSTPLADQLKLHNLQKASIVCLKKACNRPQTVTASKGSE